MKTFSKVLALFALTCVWGGVILSCSNNSDGASAPVLTYRTVTFNSDGGSEVAAQKVLTGAKAKKPADPAKTGYTFGGWFKGDAAFDFDKAVNEDVTLTARWTANTYTVTLQNEDGSVASPTTVTATYGQKLADLANIPTKLGATFGGYYTEKFAGGTKFIDKDGKGCAEWTLTSDTTLYAVFGVAITYQNTKDVASNNPDIYIVGKGVATLTALSKDGYTFNGWSKTDGGAPITEPAIPTTEDTPQTFYALWTPISYSITYEGLAGGTNPNASITSYTVETATINLADAVKANSAYGSEGWFDAATGGNKVESIPQGSTGNKTLYARWLLGAKASPSEVGDIVFNNGRAVAYSDGLVLDDAAKAAAVAVIFVATNKTGVGLQQSKLTWAPEGTTGYTTKFATNVADGSGNWAVIQAADPTGAEAAATNYPAFNFCNTYNVAVAGVSTGWYLPSHGELAALLGQKIKVNNAIGKIGTSVLPVTDAYDAMFWSSTQQEDYSENAGSYNFANGSSSYNYKSNEYYVRAIRKF